MHKKTNLFISNPVCFYLTVLDLYCNGTFIDMKWFQSVWK